MRSCGILKSYRARRSSTPYIFNGIDRIDSSRGYTAKNTVPCCKACNYAKRTMTAQELKVWLRRAAAHFLGMT